jgi:hypothetical protein
MEEDVKKDVQSDVVDVSRRSFENRLTIDMKSGAGLRSYNLE